MLLRDKTCHSEAHARNLIVLCTQQGILPPCGRQNDMIVIPSVCEESPAIRKRFFGASHLRMTFIWREILPPCGRQNDNAP